MSGIVGVRTAAPPAGGARGAEGRRIGGTGLRVRTGARGGGAAVRKGSASARFPAPPSGRPAARGAEPDPIVNGWASERAVFLVGAHRADQQLFLDLVAGAAHRPLDLGGDVGMALEEFADIVAALADPLAAEGEP